MIFHPNIWSILVLVFLYSYLSFIVAGSNTEYTDKEKLALKQFRKMVPDIMAEDEYRGKDSFLIRWLRTKKLDLNAANAMIRKAYKWRRDNQIESTVNETILEFSTPPYVFQGTDKEGRPLVFFTPTMIDLRGLVISGRRSLVVKSWDQMLERGYHYIKYNLTTLKTGEEVTQVVAIADSHGFNARQHVCVQCIPVYLELLEHFENYYPDALKYMVVINVNRVALPILEIVRPFLSESTQRSLKIFGSDKAEWSAFLRTIIDKDQLPYRFGGTKPSL